MSWSGLTAYDMPLPVGDGDAVGAGWSTATTNVRVYKTAPSSRSTPPLSASAPGKALGVPLGDALLLAIAELLATLLGVAVARDKRENDAERVDERVDVVALDAERVGLTEEEARVVSVARA